MSNRLDQRTNNEVRPYRFIKNFVPNSTGSVLAICGNTQVICTANIEDKVPGWMRAQNKSGGWVTCEYAMLPGATHTRNRRENQKGPGGRSSEIQRLIGRSLRAVVDLEKLGPVTLSVDCDVLNADGGTRTTSISGAYVAIELAVAKAIADGLIQENPLTDSLAAVSVGIVGTDVLCDLCYEEDSQAEVDMNVVVNGRGEFIEVQGTAEGMTFGRQRLNELLDCAEEGLESIKLAQKEALKEV